MRVVTSTAAEAMAETALKLIKDAYIQKADYDQGVEAISNRLDFLGITKVDSHEGMGLSSNDFTDENKATVEGLTGKQFYTQEETDVLMKDRMKYMGDITYAQLMQLGDPSVGDTYRISETVEGSAKAGDKFMWTGTGWEGVGSSGSLSLDDCKVLTPHDIDEMFEEKEEEEESDG